jgi:hypothetical protein
MSNESSKPKPIVPEIVGHETHPDEVIHVPKGSSRARFLMTFLLVVMVLTTFSVSGPLMDVFTGKGSSTKAYLTWKAADGSARSMDYDDVQFAKRALAPLAPMLFPGAKNDPTDEQTATFILINQTAEEAGVRVTDTELAKWIQDQFKSSDNYRAYLSNYRLIGKDFESTVRKLLRVERYRDLISAPLGIADPAAIEKSWKGRHQEYTFDYVELPVANLVNEARTLAPKGDELKAWFDAQPEPAKDAYKTKPMVAAEILALSLEGDYSADKIFAKYPRPAGEDLEKLARDYHQGFGYMRMPAKLDPTKGQNQSNSLPFDDVKAQAMKEAPIYESLMLWHKDVTDRAAKGEKVDLAAEAQALGLTYRKQSTPLSADGWKELTVPFIGRRTIESLFVEDKAAPMTANTYLPAIQVDEKSFVLGYVTEIQPARIPAFTEIQDAVAISWADKKARDLAVERLEKVRDAFGTRPAAGDTVSPPFAPEADAEKFAAAVKAAGFEVKVRDWRDRQAPASGTDTPAETYLRNTTTLYTQKETSVVPAALSPDGTVAYLVRIGGLRDPDPSKISLNEFEQLARNQSYQDQFLFQRLQFGSREFLEQRFGADLKSWHKTEKPQ